MNYKWKKFDKAKELHIITNQSNKSIERILWEECDKKKIIDKSFHEGRKGLKVSDQTQAEDELRNKLMEPERAFGNGAGKSHDSSTPVNTQEGYYINFFRAIEKNNPYLAEKIREQTRREFDKVIWNMQIKLDQATEEYNRTIKEGSSLLSLTTETLRYFADDAKVMKSQGESAHDLAVKTRQEINQASDLVQIAALGKHIDDCNTSVEQLKALTGMLKSEVEEAKKGEQTIEESIACIAKSQEKEIVTKWYKAVKASQAWFNKVVMNPDRYSSTLKELGGKIDQMAKESNKHTNINDKNKYNDIIKEYNENEIEIKYRCFEITQEREWYKDKFIQMAIEYAKNIHSADDTYMRIGGCGIFIMERDKKITKELDEKLYEAVKRLEYDACDTHSHLQQMFTEAKIDKLEDYNGFIVYNAYRDLNNESGFEEFRKYCSNIHEVAIAIAMKFNYQPRQLEPFKKRLAVASKNMLKNSVKEEKDET